MRAQAINVLLVLGMLVPGQVVAATSAVVDPGVSVAGVFSLAPVYGNTCLAIELPMSSDEALSGIFWYNNDGTTVFPKVLVLTGPPGQVPPLDTAAGVLEDAVGGTLTWSQIEWPQPVMTSQGAVYVVFALPAYSERDGIGAATGPGFGYLAKAGSNHTYMSLDGLNWVGARCPVAITPVKVQCASENQALVGPSSQSLLPQSSGLATGFQGVAPNPFNPSTNIEFRLMASATVTLSIYNLRGQRVTTLVNETMPPGVYGRQWLGTDEAGRAMPSGGYVARLRVDRKAYTRSLSIIR